MVPTDKRQYISQFFDLPEHLLAAQRVLPVLARFTFRHVFNIFVKGGGKAAKLAGVMQQGGQPETRHRVAVKTQLACDIRHQDADGTRMYGIPVTHDLEEIIEDAAEQHCRTLLVKTSD